ncbi:putative E3 ubiquitin-protein ligase SINAT1 [Coccinella septempunctata]|uniref:putative E3 ubiquitin-protein ligase SINAT1 n=1 Tax=Coccinella septempunctata TaxID=41139 RepID=UPI001D08B12A|nr:putative E3 ubiquitin-protein ligase SINAT1 [Coccinella septempunctata]
MSDTLDKCVSCSYYYLPPIYQCPKGHILCNHCTQDEQYMVSTSAYNLRKAKLKSITKLKLFCGKCMNFYNTNEELRNVELAIQTVKYPCIYKNDGCDFEDSYTKIKNHNETCSFMVISCFWQNCYWTGRLLDMKDHLKSHSTMKIGSHESLVNNSCFTVFVDDNFYIVKIILAKKCAQFFVVYHGEAEKYRFEINMGAKFTTNYPITLMKVIPLLKKPKTHGFSPEISEVFTVDFDFIEQFIFIDKERIYNEVQYMINVSEIEKQANFSSSPEKIAKYN